MTRKGVTQQADEHNIKIRIKLDMEDINNLMNNKREYLSYQTSGNFDIKIKLED